MRVEAEEPIFQYLELLYKCGVGSSETESFKAAYRNDPAFVILARGADRLFASKDALLAAVPSSEASANSA